MTDHPSSRSMTDHPPRPPAAGSSPAAPPGAEEIRAARRVAAQHRRRRHPDKHRCGLCGGRWEVGRTRSGRPSRGCPPRRQALEILDAVGQLDELGRPVPSTPEPTPSAGPAAPLDRPIAVGSGVGG